MLANGTRVFVKYHPDDPEFKAVVLGSHPLGEGTVYAVETEQGRVFEAKESQLRAVE